MLTQPKTRRHTREGFVLPPVIIITVLVALLAGAMEFAAWRGTRAARLAWNGERALHAADEVLATTIAQWDPITFARTPIGSRSALATQSINGATATASIVRTHTLGALIEADASSATSGTPRVARRRVARALQLRPPPLPLIATITALGALSTDSATRVSGIDNATISDECGPSRDTASVGGIAALAIHIRSLATVRGTPSTQLISDITPRSQFNSAWITLMRRASSHGWPAASAPFSPQPAWSATVFDAPIDATLNGSSAYEGLLAINGNLTLRGTLHVRGLLVVLGALDSRLGQLDVEGAVLVADINNSGSMLGNSVNVRYSQCALRRALATIAIPSTRPFAIWQER